MPEIVMMLLDAAKYLLLGVLGLILIYAVCRIGSAAVYRSKADFIRKYLSSQPSKLNSTKEQNHGS